MKIHCRQVCRNKTGDGGMTLIEFLAAMAIFTVVIYTLCHLWGFAYQDWTDGMIAEQLQRQAQDAMGVMESDVKQAQYNTTDTTYQQPIATISTNEIVINGNFDTDPQLEQMHFRLQNMVLQQGLVQMNGVGAYASEPSPSSWTTFLTSVSGASPIFTVTSNGGYHYSLSITTLTVNSRIKPSVSIQFNGALGVRGNSYLEQQLSTDTL
jgi:prepilin-type N-terminal cleavage/methylation domain-containing protein